MRRATTRVLGWLSVLCLAPTACAPAPAEPPEPGMVLPLDAYTATAQERALVDRAYVALLNQCTASLGFPRRATPPRSPEKSSPVAWRYGVHDPALAAKYGYHPPPEYRDDGTDERAAAQRRYARDPMSDAELSAHLRCVDDAQRQLGKPDGGSHMDDVLAQTLGMTSFERSAADPRVTEAVRRWSACLREAGHTAEDPATVMAGFDLTTAEPGPREVALAEADVACKHETGLVGTWHAVETEYQNSLLAKNIDALRAGRRSVDTAVDAAARVLGVPAPR